MSGIISSKSIAKTMLEFLGIGKDFNMLKISKEKAFLTQRTEALRRNFGGYIWKWRVSPRGFKTLEHRMSVEQSTEIILMLWNIPSEHILLPFLESQSDKHLLMVEVFPVKFFKAHVFSTSCCE